MKDISIKDLTNLVVAEVPDTEARIEKMFDWHFARDMTITKWILSIAASLGISILAVLFRADNPLALWQIIVLLLIPLSAASFGLYRLMHIRLMHKEFCAALTIYNELKKIKSFITKYKDTLRNE